MTDFLTRKDRAPVAISKPGPTEKPDSWRAFSLRPGQAPHLLAVGAEGEARYVAILNGQSNVDVIEMPETYTAAAPPAIYRPGHGTGPFESTLPVASCIMRERALQVARRAADAVIAARDRNRNALSGPREYRRRVG